MSAASDKIEHCSAQMLLQFPWWASIYLHLRRIETMALPTMAVDGRHLFFNPIFTESLTDRECMGVLMHETAHIALMHCYRRMHREHKRWNVACDKAVNAVLAAAGIKLPKGGVPPANLGVLAEELYEQITPEEMELYCWDVLEPGTAGVAGATGISSEQEWRDALASSRGLMPGYVARLIDEALAPRNNWKELLAQFIHATHRSDARTWSRPSRRVVGFPGWKREPESRLAICIDTSGSVTHETLNVFVSECQAITALTGITAVLISCDAAVTQVVPPGEPFPQELVGGGGTSFIPALKEAELHEPDAIIYFTDGDGEYPKECAYPVLWALTKPHAVPLGEKIELEIGN